MAKEKKAKNPKNPKPGAAEPHGMRKGLTNYGDLGFSIFLRKAFIKAMGYSDEALNRPIVGITNTYSDYNPCHGNVPQIIEAVKRGVMLSGAMPMVFPTISIAESFAFPTSMYMRNLMAMDTEEMIRAQPMDSVVLIGGCDKTLPAQLMAAASVDRPAIAVQWPTVESECIVLDVGANVGADARQLVEFALMGAAMARALFGMERPTVGLLNIGVEEVKGLDEIKAAYAALKDTPLPIEFRGFVEGDDIGHGAADVVVTDGFTGNIALKTAEGTAKQIGEYFRAAMRRSLLARLGAVLAQGAFRALKEKMDPRQLNGGIFLGLNGIVVKSHGGTDATGFASAVDTAYDMASSGVVKRLAADVARFHAELELDGAA